MIEIKKPEDCSGCYACFNICPETCIEMVDDREGFFYPKVDNSKCIRCSLCVKICPLINIKERVNTNRSYACINKNESIRVNSSSGGVFTLLAESIINSGGVVFGAGFDVEFNLIHTYAENNEDLSLFRGSKYLQSKIVNSFSKAKGLLDMDLNVLFSGTPCQIAGLLSYLGRDYDNLICVDIICHGVPSPKIFKLYRTELEQKYTASSQKIDFRNKKYGWRSFSLSFKFNNHSEYLKPHNQDIFMQGFLHNLFLRPSCYSCKFKTLNRLSDLTLADFWGVENICKNLDDNLGTSLLLVNSEKGNTLIQKILDKMIIQEVNCAEAIKYNPSAIESAPKNPNREKFFKQSILNEKGIGELILKYDRISFARRTYVKNRVILSIIKGKIKSLFK
jgi:coenzyme F420-reducing hydrogenase beta subunit